MASTTASRKYSGVNTLLAAVLCITAACVVQQAAVLFTADWLSSSARQRVIKWSERLDSYAEDDSLEVEQDLKAALSWTPKDATLQDAMAQLYSVKGQVLWTTGEPDSPEVQAYKKALHYQKASLQLRPTHAMAWANLALIHYAVNSTPEELVQAWKEAARLAPKERSVEEMLVLVAKDTWTVQPPENRAWIETRRPGFTAKMAAKYSGITNKANTTVSD